MRNNGIQERNIGLDILKCICAFFVITIHCKMLPGPVGVVLTALNRTAVPIFFMITGFFYQRTVDSGQIKRQIIKILKLTCWASLFYFIYNGFFDLVTGSTLTEYIGSYLTLKVIVKFLVLCASPFQGHLWYLSAILYVLVAITLFETKWSRKRFYWLIPILLVGHLMLGKYARLLWGKELPMSLVRNEVFVGLPFFLLGDYLYQKRDDIVSSLTDKKMLITGIMLILVVTSILENQFLVTKGLTTKVEQGISTILLAMTLFILFLKQCDRRGIRRLAQIGKRYSTMIYIIHPTFLTLFNLLIEKPFSGSNTVIEIYRWIASILVF